MGMPAPPTLCVANDYTCCARYYYCLAVLAVAATQNEVDSLTRVREMTEQVDKLKHQVCGGGRGEKGARGGAGGGRTCQSAGSSCGRRVGREN